MSDSMDERKAKPRYQITAQTADSAITQMITILTQQAAPMWAEPDPENPDAMCCNLSDVQEPVLSGAMGAIVRAYWDRMEPGTSAEDALKDINELATHYIGLLAMARAGVEFTETPPSARQVN